MKTTDEKQAGYIALISVIMVTGAFLLLLTGTNLAVFFGREELLEHDFKEQSRTLSEACLDIARLWLVYDSGYGGNESIAVGSSTCQILAVAASGSDRVIPARGVSSGAYTNLRAVVSASGTVIRSIEELVRF